VIREVVVNAVMHRCYKVHGTVQIIRYNNRLEIRNPGHSLISEEQFGQPTSQTRNPSIAAALYDLGFAENKGSGLRAVQNLMRRAMLPPPMFESNREANRFVAYLLMHHLLTPEDVRWLSQFTSFELADDEKVAMIIAREMGAIDNATYRTIGGCDTLIASGHLRRLRDLNLLSQRGKGNKTHYVLPDDFPSAKVGLSGGLEVQSGESMAQSGGLNSKEGGSGFVDNADFNADVSPVEVPNDIAERLPPLGRRASRSDVRRAILELCFWRPLMPTEIANYLKRKSVKRFVEDYVSPLFGEGLLERTIPENPTHPAQKYKTTAEGIQRLL
jgi:ATP-dependent DNA helicase RecG